MHNTLSHSLHFRLTRNIYCLSSFDNVAVMLVLWVAVQLLVPPLVRCAVQWISVRPSTNIMIEPTQNDLILKISNSTPRVLVAKFYKHGGDSLTLNLDILGHNDRSIKMETCARVKYTECPQRSDGDGIEQWRIRLQS